MNNYFLLHHIVLEAGETLKEAETTGCFTRMKNVLEVTFRKEEKDFALHIDISPGNWAFFLEEADKRSDFAKVNLFEVVLGSLLTKIDLRSADRIIDLHFSCSKILSIYLFGSRSNITLVDQISMETEGFFKKKELPKSISIVESKSDGRKPIRRISDVDYRLPKEFDVVFGAMNGFATAELLAKRAHELIQQAFNKPHFRSLESGGITLWDEADFPEKTSRVFPSANEMVRWFYYSERQKYRLEQGKAHFLERIASRFERLQRRIQEETDRTSLEEKAEALRRKGDSIMAALYQKPEEPNTFQIADVYGEQKPHLVQVPAGKTLADSANDLYGKARRIKERAEKADSIKLRLMEEVANLNVLKAQAAEVSGLKELQKLEKLAGATDSELDESKTVSGVTKKEINGYEVWIGRNANGNDAVLQLSHKEDIWFHARGVGGSHVVIKNNRRLDFPQKQILERVAEWAAWRSKARGSDWVPVQVTKRKFVRKVKGGAPGMVIVQKEEVLIVKPQSDGALDES